MNAENTGTNRILMLDVGRLERSLAALSVHYVHYGPMNLSAFKALSRDEAEALLKRWREANAGLVEAYSRANLLAQDFSHSAALAMPPKEKKRSKVRQSAKTGATWPKPKGSY